jgi:hypothetical protein
MTMQYGALAEACSEDRIGDSPSTRCAPTSAMLMGCGGDCRASSTAERLRCVTRDIISPAM